MRWLRKNAERLEPHGHYICLGGRDLADTRKAKNLLDKLIAENCPATPACDTD